MNDDFLRNARRAPPAAFANQLRERLRQQELAETSRRRPGWKLLIASLFVAGTALATATYLMLSDRPLLAFHSSEHASTDTTSNASSAGRQHGTFGTIRPNLTSSPQGDSASMSSAQSTGAAGDARDGGDSSVAPASPAATTNGSNLPSSPPGASTAALVRVVITPDLEALFNDSWPLPRPATTASLATDDADVALRALCTEAPEHRPDIVLASRRISREELKPCEERGAEGMMEANLGHIAAVITRARTGVPMQISADTLRRAVLKRVPSPRDPAQLIDNPYTHWNQIDPSLEARRIDVLGPARDSQEFHLFAATLLDPACEQYSPDCRELRDDGFYEEVRFDANFVRQRLWSDPGIVAVVTYQFYAANSADLIGSLLPGVAPKRETFVNGSYSAALPLYLYVTKSRYNHAPAVWQLMNDFLRTRRFSIRGVVTSPDGDDSSWRTRPEIPLTEVKL